MLQIAYPACCRDTFSTILLRRISNGKAGSQDFSLSRHGPIDWCAMPMLTCISLMSYSKRQHIGKHLDTAIVGGNF